MCQVVIVRPRPSRLQLSARLSLDRFTLKARYYPDYFLVWRASQLPIGELSGQSLRRLRHRGPL